MTLNNAGTDRVPAFLVLMATRNGEAWVEQQLQSILSQQGVSLRVLISDDASTDRTVSLLRAVAQHDQRVELLPEASPSGSACANFMRLIRSVNVDPEQGYTHVALSDQDDVWHPDKLRRAALHMSHEGADLYSGAVTARWLSGKTKDLLQRSVPTGADHLFEGAGQGCTFVLNRPLFEQVHAVAHDAATLLSPVHYHDWLIYALARSWNRRWFYDPVPTMVYRQHAANDTGARGSISGIRLRVGRISSDWYGQQVRAVLTVCRHVNPGHEAAAHVEALISAARRSAWGRLRWWAFILTRSRRRLSDRLVLAAFTGLGMF
jgi:rhamnosyltransferase